MKKIISLAVALLLCLCPLCHAQQRLVIDKELRTMLAEDAGEMMSVNIVLKSQPNPERVKVAVYGVKDTRAARVMVVDELKAHSCKRQSALLEYLYKAEQSGLVADISCHWIANVITCNATKEVVEVLASHPDVLAIGYNREVQIIDGFDAVVGVQAVATASSHSATPHVLQVNADDVWAQGYTG